MLITFLSRNFLFRNKRQVSIFLELSELSNCSHLSVVLKPLKNLLEIIFASTAVYHVMNMNILSKLSGTTFKEEPTGTAQYHCLGCHWLNGANHSLLKNPCSLTYTPALSCSPEEYFSTIRTKIWL